MELHHETLGSFAVLGFERIEELAHADDRSEPGRDAPAEILDAVAERDMQIGAHQAIPLLHL